MCHGKRVQPFQIIITANSQVMEGEVEVGRALAVDGRGDDVERVRRVD